MTQTPWTEWTESGHNYLVIRENKTKSISQSAWRGRLGNEEQTEIRIKTKIDNHNPGRGAGGGATVG
jgi:hypothetical protein